MRKGSVCEVVDVSDPRGPKKLPFAKGAMVTVADVREQPPGKVWVQLVGYHGFFAGHRFAVRSNG